LVIAFVASLVFFVQYNLRGSAIIVRTWRRDRFSLLNDLFKETWKVVITLIITAALPVFYVAYKFATGQWSSILGTK
jgi:amino acid permease